MLPMIYRNELSISLLYNYTVYVVCVECQLHKVSICLGEESELSHKLDFDISSDVHQCVLLSKHTTTLALRQRLNCSLFTHSNTI